MTDDCNCCVMLYQGIRFSPSQTGTSGDAPYWEETINGQQENVTIKEKSEFQMPCGHSPRPDLGGSYLPFQPATVVNGGGVPPQGPYGQYTSWTSANPPVEVPNGGFSSRGDFEAWLEETSVSTNVEPLNDGEEELEDGVCDPVCDGSAEPECSGTIRLSVKLLTDESAPDDALGFRQGALVVGLTTSNATVKVPNNGRGDEEVALTVEYCDDYEAISFYMTAPNGNRIATRDDDEFVYLVALSCGPCIDPDA